MLVPLLLACATGPEAAAVPLTELPNGAAMPTVDGEQSLAKKSSAIIGLMRIKGESVDQNIGWGKSKRTLSQSAKHEQGLVYEALGLTAPPSDELVSVEVAGTPAMQWSVDGGSTHFMGASFDLCGQRIALVTFGASADEVAKGHAASLAGAVCTRP